MTEFSTNNGLINDYQKVRIKKVIELMKDELGGKTMTKFVTFRPKI